MHVRAHAGGEEGEGEGVGAGAGGGGGVEGLMIASLELLLIVFRVMAR